MNEEDVKEDDCEADEWEREGVLIEADRAKVEDGVDMECGVGGGGSCGRGLAEAEDESRTLDVRRGCVWAGMEEGGCAEED